MAVRLLDTPTYAVRLLKLHEHDGQEYPEGTLLTVDRPTRDFLQAHGVIDRPATKPTTTTSDTDIKGN